LIRTAIIGASGYSGMELLKILSSREDIALEYVFANSNAGKYISEIIPSMQSELDMRFENYDAGLINSLDIVFVSLPSGESMKIVPGILSKGIKVIDMGGDFRLKEPLMYEQYYKFEHSHRELLSESVYGLSEIYHDEIANADLIANPGCYPTSILLPLIPLLKNGIISPHNIVINSLSGVSGAGKKESFDCSFTEVNENIRAYKISDHQHVPEIKQVLEKEINNKVSFTFIPALVPITRGIHTTIITDMQIQLKEHDIYDSYKNFYGNSSFIRLRKNPPNIKDVVNTNFCDIYLKADLKNNKLVLISVIDNLLKGAAGQAVQNMNILFNLPESFGFIKKEKHYV